MRGRIALLLVVALSLAIGPTALDMAQTSVAVNPTTVQFTPSADHAALNVDGTPVVTRYDLRVYVPTILTTIVFTQTLGKPTPGTDGTIQASLGTGIVAALVKNTQYVAEVVAIGPYGEGVSTPSNPFGYAAPPRAGGVPILK